MEAGRGIDSADASGLCPNVAGDVAQTALPFVKRVHIPHWCEITALFDFMRRLRFVTLDI